jgi:hypothetical protein
VSARKLSVARAGSPVPRFPAQKPLPSYRPNPPETGPKPASSVDRGSSVPFFIGLKNVNVRGATRNARSSAAEAVVAEIVSAGGRAIAGAADVADSVAVEAMVARTDGKYTYIEYARFDRSAPTVAVATRSGC